jgi:hypothetical protein
MLLIITIVNRFAIDHCLDQMSKLAFPLQCLWLCCFVAQGAWQRCGVCQSRNDCIEGAVMARKVRKLKARCVTPRVWQGIFRVVSEYFCITIYC